MPKATFNGKVIAESTTFESVDGNVYFPPSSIKAEYFKDSAQTSVCPYKGTASYKDIVVDGKVNAGACWYYPDPKPGVANIKGHYAFWKGVQVDR